MSAVMDVQRQYERVRSDRTLIDHFGFTGTHHGMTDEQKERVRSLLADHRPILHLGDCIGADEQAYDIATELGLYRVGHPPDNNSKRAFCEYDEERDPLPYLQRNAAIVLEGQHGLIATPKDFTMPRDFRGQGTWSTILKGMRAGRALFVYTPDGEMWEQFPKSQRRTHDR